MTILITGAAGFIGFHLARRMKGRPIVGLDNLNHYYDVSLKHARLELLGDDFAFFPIDLVDKEKLFHLFEQYQFTHVIHLAAQAGVRYSLQNPESYVQSNLVGFCNILEACRHFKISHLIFASSSSVYGANTKIPYSEADRTVHPVSLYAATKKANEVIAHSYAHLFQIPMTGLRFFTVYGPLGRPDMAYFDFTRKILAGEPIVVYNQGDMMRDFTYIDDVVDGIVNLIDKIPTGTPPYQLLNIGNHQPVRLGDFIEILEQCLQKKAIIEYAPMQPGDVLNTYADNEKLYELTGFRPKTSLEDGLKKFVEWYLETNN